jgi:hypothetical protein
MKHEYKHQLLLYIYSWYRDFISRQQQHTLELPLVSGHCDGIKQADALYTCNNKVVTASSACYFWEAIHKLEIN